MIETKLKTQIKRQYKIRDRRIEQKLDMKGFIRSAHWSEENGGTVTFETVENLIED